MKKHDGRILMMALVVFLCGCKTAPPIHLGSLNESGTPDKFLVKLERRQKYGADDVRIRRAVEGLKIAVGDQGLLTISNSSNFYFDQVSFACDVGGSQSVYFTWDAGILLYAASKPSSKRTFQRDLPKTGKFQTSLPIAWLEPNTSHRIFSIPAETLSLWHNQPMNEEELDFGQFRWLANTFHPQNCIALDVADATEIQPAP